MPSLRFIATPWLLLSLLLLAGLVPAQAQTYGVVRGTIRTTDTGQPLPFATVRVREHRELGTVADSLGRFELARVPTGPKHLEITAVGYASRSFDVIVYTTGVAGADVLLRPAAATLGEVRVEGARPVVTPGRLADVSGTGLYAGRRTEVVEISSLQANLAAAPARVALARIPGANVPEIDGAAVQLSIGTRGLNPNRVQEFNARQNGYDIAADPLGYPESYYTPPLEGVAQVEVVRGAAALQYGPQFGGLLHFRMKQPPTEQRLALTARQTVGSFGLASSFLSAGGTVGRISYYGFGLFKRADGWRENNGLWQATGYGTVSWLATSALKLTAEMTSMRYQMQQPGGRTDAEFATDPRGSSRARNWYATSWQMPALLADYAFSDRTRLNVRAAGLLAYRYSLGNLTAIDKPDDDGERDFLADHYRNAGVEARLLHRYDLGARLSGHLLAGARLYRGHTSRQQGKGPAGDRADFTFLRPAELESFDYTFPSWNTAVFVENLLHLSPRLTVTPGARLEYIRTDARGYYRFAGAKVNDQLTRTRSFPLLGLSTGYQLTSETDLYASITQNYAAVSFNDMRVSNPNLRVDPNLKDQRGYSAEAGWRGQLGTARRDWLRFDVGVFYLSYHNRIGTLNGNYRTNVADSRSLGIETFVEVKLLGSRTAVTAGGSESAVPAARGGELALFGTYGFTDARYVNAEQPAIQHKAVEMAPRHIVRAGLTYRWRRLGLSAQAARTSEQYTDATNARLPNPSATLGVIPAYTVLDAGLSYAFRRVTLSTGAQNLGDTRYFTRRSTGYPGPGILPADGRSFYATVEVRL